MAGINTSPPESSTPSSTNVMPSDANPAGLPVFHSTFSSTDQLVHQFLRLSLWSLMMEIFWPGTTSFNSLSRIWTWNFIIATSKIPHLSMANQEVLLLFLTSASRPIAHVVAAVLYKCRSASAICWICIGLWHLGCHKSTFLCAATSSSYKPKRKAIIRWKII